MQIIRKGVSLSLELLVHIVVDLQKQGIVSFQLLGNEEMLVEPKVTFINTRRK